MELLALASRYRGRAAARPSRWLAPVRDRLHEGFRAPLPGLEELAREAGVHPVHLARAFRAAYGTSPGGYLRRRRLEWAAEQLRQSERPLAAIASEAGFADQSHFTRAFRAAYGEPPGAWRRARRGSPPT
jgi:AraC family transcriptional regulator